MTALPQLVDRFGRAVTYLRISVTDRCDFRCVYCMDEEMQFLPRSQLLSYEEITRIATAFADLGVTKIRITGGEPLTRHGIDSLFSNLGELSSVNDLTLTTNGSQLTRYAQKLKTAGVTRINVSLDTLDETRFTAMTRTGKLEQTLAGIDVALACDFNKLKLNAVIMRGSNDDEITSLVDYAIEKGLDISFIEEMPLGQIAHDRALSFMSSDEVLNKIQQHHQLVSVPDKTGGPSRYHQVEGTSTRVGLISPHSHNFCDDCNRVRLTSEGMLLLCLGQEHSVDLRQILRDGASDAELRQAILDSMQIKPKGHDFNLQVQPIIMRHMSATGG